jgi:excisionase family DNA binding protein
MTKMLTKKETAALFNISERTLDRWRERGLLQALKVGGIVRFDLQAVAALVDQLSRPGRPSP